MIVISIVIELAVFRPLRTAAPLAKLVASLGVLLTAQASMLLAFGTSQHPQPTIIPCASSACSTRRCRCPPSCSAAIVVAMTVVLLGALSLDALRTRHPGGVGERRRRPPRRPVAERAVARQHAARQPAARHARDPCRHPWRRSTRPRCRSSSCLRSPPPSSRGSRRSGSRALRARHRHDRVADRVLLDEVVVPDHRGAGRAGRQGAARLRAHRGGDVPARRVAADARRARRAAPTRRAPTEALGQARDPLDASSVRSRSSCCRSTSARR